MSPAPPTIYGLGIESSCDETSASILCNGYRVLSLVVNSQIPIHAPYSGVVPELASRNHLLHINEVLEAALKQASISWSQIQYISVTSHPGLIGSLLIGLTTAKAISLATGIPLIGVNHLAAHLHAPFLSFGNWQGPEFPEKPFFSMIISGGNTALVLYKSPEELHLLGSTRDDSCGESLDKVAKLLDLGYPGGPIMEKLAARSSFIQGRNLNEIPIPPILADSPKKDLSFSFSGIKTSVWYLLQAMQRDEQSNKKSNQGNFTEEDIAFSLQYRIGQLLSRNTERLLMQYKKAITQGKVSRYFVLAGGVSANQFLRGLLKETVEKYELELAVPPPVLCTDNAAMVAACGYFLWKKGKKSGLELEASSKAHWHSKPGDNKIFFPG